VANVFITKNGPVQVAHDLMHIDQDSPATLGTEGNRLDVRVNLGPLLRPVSSDLLMTANDAPPLNARGHATSGAMVAKAASKSLCSRGAPLASLPLAAIWILSVGWPPRGPRHSRLPGRLQVRGVVKNRNGRSAIRNVAIPPARYSNLRPESPKPPTNSGARDMVPY
jgi:hypothetical protein